MILIITINDDILTSNVCIWLLHFKAGFKVISSTDVVHVKKIDKNDLIIQNETRGYSLNLNEVRKIFYRQGGVFFSSILRERNQSELQMYLKEENQLLIEFLYFKMAQIEHIGLPQKSNLNKLIVLEKAARFGLLVPDYIYTSERHVVKDFIKRKERVITKIILPAFKYESSEEIKACYTELFTLEDVENLAEVFHSTFFQKLIPKKCDLRIFYFSQQFYSIAIFSQNNILTEVDYRHYDKAVPNKQVAFDIPDELKLKLKNLIDDLKLQYCSIDMIYSCDKKFYFLEINPIGQFGNVSYYGNYYLEQKMAQSLI